MSDRFKTTTDPRKRRRRSEAHGILEMIRQYSPTAKTATQGITVSSGQRDTGSGPTDNTAWIDQQVVIPSPGAVTLDIGTAAEIKSVHGHYDIRHVSGIMDAGFFVIIHNGLAASVGRGVATILPVGSRAGVTIQADVVGGKLRFKLSNAASFTNATVQFRYNIMEV